VADHLLLAPGLGTAPPLSDLLVRLARRHHVAAHDPGLGPPAAVLARPSTPWRREWADATLAWWVEHPRELPDSLPERVRLLVTWPPVAQARPSVARAGPPVEVVPAPSVDGAAWRPMMPFVRARLRRRLGLPDGLVAVVGTVDAPALADETANDALLLAAAAVVGPGHVLRALALATPTVCDAATAELVGAVAGEHVVVATSAEAREAAAHLAADLERAAVLGRQGRRLVESRHDIAASARRVAAALGLAPVGPPPVGRVAGLLEDLGTPVGAGIAARVAGAVGSLGAGSAEVATRSLRW